MDRLAIRPALQGKAFVSKPRPSEVNRHTTWRRSRTDVVLRLACVGLSAAWIAIGVGCAGGAVSNRWIRVQTEHFHLISNLDARVTQRIADRLETFVDVVGQFIPSGILRFDHRSRVLVSDDRNVLSDVRPQFDAAGNDHAPEGGVEIVLEMNDLERSLQHGYASLVRYYLEHQAMPSLPAWYREGIIEFLSVVQVSDEVVWIGGISGELAMWLRYGVPLPLNTLMTFSSVGDLSEDSRDRFRAQSWALVHFLSNARFAGFPSRSQQVIRYLELVANGTKPGDACRNAFGTDFNGLEREFLRYIAIPKVPIAAFPRSDFGGHVIGQAQPIDLGELSTLASDQTVGFDAEHSQLAQSERMSLTRYDTPGPQIAVFQPEDGAVIRSAIEFIAIEGRSGIGKTIGQDIVIAIDESLSTFDAIGRDVDGDGRIVRTGPFPTRQPFTRQPSPGRWVTPRPMRKRDDSSIWKWSSDYDDTVIEAELLAVRDLLRQLNPHTTRVAIISFAGSAQIRSQLGAPDEALRALDGYEVHLDWSGTNPASALLLAIDLLADARKPSELSQWTVVLLSDGKLPESDGKAVSTRTVEVARLLSRLGIQLKVFALRPAAVEEPGFLEDVSMQSDAELIHVETAADLVSDIAAVPLTGLVNVDIRNLRTGEPGQVIRVFPDGSFDGYLHVEPGKNEFEVIASMRSGAQVTLTREIVLQVPDRLSAEDLADAERMKQALQLRTAEMELLAERLDRKRKELVLEVEP